jgi:hypothetical protein
MRWPPWLGIGERRWKKSPEEEVQPGKTLWDFLQLLIVPAMLAALALLFNASQESRDRKRDANARMDATLDGYLAQMSSLMLNDHLLTSKEGSDVRTVARTATLTTVRRLDGRRKAEVVRFLFEAQLLFKFPGPLEIPVVMTEDADLRDAELDGVFFNQISLAGADLRGASFDNASLAEVDFENADLRGATFRHALITADSFGNSNLTDAVFDDATFQTVGNPATPTNFYSSCLTNTSFARVKFQGETRKDRNAAVFPYTVGRNTDFRDADLSGVLGNNAWLADVRLDGAKGRPKAWGANGPRNVPSRRTDDRNSPCQPRKS